MNAHPHTGRSCHLVVALLLHGAVAENKTPEIRKLLLGSVTMDIPIALY